MGVWPHNQCLYPIWTQVKLRSLGMVEDSELLRARLELTQFEGHFRDAQAPAQESREAPPFSGQAVGSNDLDQARESQAAKEATAMDDRTQPKRGTRQGPSHQVVPSGGKGEGHGEQDRDKETDKHLIQEDDPQQTRPSRVRFPSRARDKDLRLSSRSQKDEDNK